MIIEKYELADLHGEKPPKKSPPRFVASIPLDWITSAAKLDGKCLHVALALWYRKCLTKKETITIPKQVRMEFGISRTCYARCLEKLQNANLIELSKATGRSTRARIIH